MKPKTKIVLILTGVFLILLSLLGYYIYQNKELKKERDEQQINTNTLLSLYKGKETALTLTQNQVRMYINANDSLDALLKKERIKPRDIDVITEIEHHYHVDTLWLPAEETGTGWYEAPYSDSCISVKGTFQIEPKPLLLLTGLDYHPKLTIIGYEDKVKTGEKTWIFFNKKRKVYSVKVSSDCGENKTQSIKMIKNK